MSETNPEKDHEAIRQIIKSINQAWLMERFEEMDQYFHPSVIFVRPKFGGRLDGRESCINSYREFISQAKVREYRDGEPTINLFGATAIATYPYHMLYELAEESYREHGYDNFVLAKVDNKWQVVWRTMFIHPGVSA